MASAPIGQHTPTPWKFLDSFEDRLNGYAISSDGRLVASAWYMGGTERARANAAFIVKAVNSHEIMVSALQNAILQIEYLQEKFSVTGSGNAAIALARAALFDAGVTDDKRSNDSGEVNQ